MVVCLTIISTQIKSDEAIETKWGRLGSIAEFGPTALAYAFPPTYEQARNCPHGHQTRVRSCKDRWSRSFWWTRIRGWGVRDKGQSRRVLIKGKSAENYWKVFQQPWRRIAIETYPSSQKVAKDSESGERANPVTWKSLTPPRRRTLCFTAMCLNRNLIRKIQTAEQRRFEHRCLNYAWIKPTLDPFFVNLQNS